LHHHQCRSLEASYIDGGEVGGDHLFGNGIARVTFPMRLGPGRRTTQRG